MNSELEIINKLVFEKIGFELSNLFSEPESKEYFAHTFRINEKKIVFRVAKITPTKIGQFVTIWKRNEKGITSPYSNSDYFDYFIIATKKENLFGIFIFSKKVLVENKIISSEKIDGKRGIRVYPIWDIAINKQAQKTQLWQMKCFVDLSDENSIDIEKVKELLM